VTGFNAPITPLQAVQRMGGSSFVPEIDLENKALRIGQIDIFSPEGKYLYKARLNFGKDRTHLFSPLRNIVIKSGFLYAVLQDEEDNVLVGKFRVSLPNAGAQRGTIGTALF